MKIKQSGVVTFSIRKNDVDLLDLIKDVPDGSGSDILRELIRSGLAYQKLAHDGTVPPNLLTMLMDRFELLEHIGVAGNVEKTKKVPPKNRLKKTTENKSTSSTAKPKQEQNKVIEEPTLEDELLGDDLASEIL